MTLDEAIKHEEEIVKEEQYEYQECVATHDTEGAMNCRKYAEEHRQLAEWLKDYKRLLEQEPCEDAISRQMVLDKMKERDEELSSICPKDIRDLPPVTPQMKTGHWIGIDEEPHEDYECDKCGYTISTYTANIEPHTEYKFCPNCGAKMKGEADGK